VYETPLSRKLLHQVAAVVATIALAFGLVTVTSLLVPLPMAQAASIGSTVNQSSGFNLKPGSLLSRYVSIIHFGGFKVTESTGTVIIGYCQDSKLELPRSDQLMTITTAKRFGANAPKAFFAMGQYGAPEARYNATTNNQRATALFILLRQWEVKDDGIVAQLPFYLKQLSAANQAGVNAWMSIIKTDAEDGDIVSFSASYNKLTAPGGKDKFVVTLKSKATGRVLKNRYVTVKIAGGKLLSRASGYSNAKGQFAVSYQKTNTTSVVLTVQTTSGDGHHGLSNIKKASEQWMLFTGLKVTRSVSYKYNWVTGVKLAKACAPNCDGTGTVSATAVNTASPWYEVVTIANKDTGAIVKTFRAAPGATSVVTLKSVDGTMLDTTVCYAALATAACSTASVKVGATYEVTCPPAPMVWFSYGCNCGGVVSGAKALVVTPGTIRVDKAQIVVNGVAVGGLIDLQPSSSQELDLSKLELVSGDVVVIRVYSYHQVSGLLLATWDYER
jgi:hypothetical protein